MQNNVFMKSAAPVKVEPNNYIHGKLILNKRNFICIEIIIKLNLIIRNFC